MGAASSVFGRGVGGQPNLYAMEQLIARYEELKPRSLSSAELYYQLQQVRRWAGETRGGE